MGLKNHQFQPQDHDFKILLEGRSYTYSQDFTVAKGATVNFLIKTGNDDVIINTVESDTYGSEVAFIGYSDSSVSNDGTEIFPVNYNRQSDRASKTKLFQSPVIVNDGVKIISRVTYAPSAPSKISLSKISVLGKYVLNKNSYNVFRIVNRDANTAAKISIVIDYIEVEL